MSKVKATQNNRHIGSSLRSLGKAGEAGDAPLHARTRARMEECW
ncbi:hypothetical protein N9L68_09370 [bacterium]|nr:hypothetical protein [bacterium]